MDMCSRQGTTHWCQHYCNRHGRAAMLTMVQLILATAPVTATWIVYNDTNAAPGDVSSANSTVVVPNVPTGVACQAACEARPPCDVFAWSPNTHHCYLPAVHLWRTGSPNNGYVSGCNNATVPRCGYDERTAPCPAYLPPTPSTADVDTAALGHNDAGSDSSWLHGGVPARTATTTTGDAPVSVHVGPRVGRASAEFGMLGFNFDFWPSSKDGWGTCGVLTSQLGDARLLALASRLNGSLLRIGGSPADFMVYDVFPGACSPDNINRTQSHGDSGYFCPIWDQVQGQCLTMERWAEINAFALQAGLSIAFDLNACWGRRNKTAPMDMSMIFGLFNATATMAKNKASAVYAFQFGNELYYNVEGTRYGTDMLAMSTALHATWLSVAPNERVPTLIGPDNGAVEATNVDEILNATKGAMTAVTYHDYWNSCADGSIPAGLVLNTTCIDEQVSLAVGTLEGVASKHGVPLWLSEGALHSNSGVVGLTNTWTSTLWYAHTLGQLAQSGVELFSRQTLLGGNYEIVDKATGLPNPDYWMALAWHDFVGHDVFNTTLEGCRGLCASALRVHAHSAASGGGSGSGNVLVVVNFALNASFDVDVAVGHGGQQTVKKTAAAHSKRPAEERLDTVTRGTSAVRVLQLVGRAGGSAVVLNGKTLTLSAHGAPPLFVPIDVPSGAVHIPPTSVTLVLLPPVNH